VDFMQQNEKDEQVGLANLGIQERIQAQPHMRGIGIKKENQICA
jgi:hypothetical protein